MAEIRLSARARRDLVDMRLYGNERFGASAADAYFLRLEAAFDLLVSYPQAGPARPELGAGIRLLMHRRHRIFYRIEADGILVMRVMHHATDTPGLIDD